MKTKIYNLSLKTIATLATIILLYGIALNAQETVTDYDGNVYQTVTIGTQVWMKENLKTTHYLNGEAIPNVTGASEWSGMTTGAYCNYNNDSTYVATYGRLYNWYSVNDSRNLCPTGWHVPTDAEWTTLVNYLGGENVAGGKMKEAGTTHWKPTNDGATNTSGFTAFPGGGRLRDVQFGSVETDGNWWCSTEFNSTLAWYRGLRYFSPKIFRDNDIKTMGFSVRCLKDETVGIGDQKKDIDLKIFPNPTTGLFTISFGATVHEALIEIFNLQGNLLLSKIYHNTATATIDLSGLSKGIYLVKVLIEGEIFIEKIILE